MSMIEQDAAKKPVRVLIADDDPVLRSLVAANLARRVDSVTEAVDGYQAWDLLLNRTFELALIDLSMPNIDGFTLIQCMRGHPRTKHMPIIVITSSTDRESIERAFEVGATSFLTKPVNLGLFGHHIDYLIRLNQSGDLARTTMQQAEAIARAKDAVIATLAARIRKHTATLSTTAQQQLRPREADLPLLPAPDLARLVLAEARAITEVCDATLPHLRSVTEQIVVDDRTVLVERVIERGIALVTELAQRGQVAIEVGAYHRHITLRCDEAALARALASLLRNAVQHSEPGGLVGIIVELRDDNVLAITVADHGRGAAPEHVAACLRPLDQPRGLGGDAVEHIRTGLGLPIAKAIAQAHGGTLEISTALGQGTSASLILPADIVEVRHDHAA